ncbi:unnamed protein product [Orchesella dallaii]|uniref:Odorant receptor n=1 Tax=Orchesella dallaii TaxID=48710 RepID=A0ABP1S4E6_9HEXA
MGTSHPILMGIFLLQKWLTNDYRSSTFDFIVFTLGRVELCIVIGTLTICYRLKLRYENVIYILNQIFRYSDTMKAFIKSSNGKLNQNQMKRIRRTEFLVALTAGLTTFVPFAYGACLCIPMEATHAVLQEWLEIDVSAAFEFAPLILFFVWMVSNGGSVIFIAATVMLEYMVLAINCISVITPDRVRTQKTFTVETRTIRYEVQTSCFKSLDDMQVVNMYRTQQIINNILNEILATILFSLHHVFCLVIFVGTTYTILKVPEVLATGGPLTLFGFICGALIPVFLEYFEAIELNELTEVSMTFKGKCNDIMSRRSMLRKFAVSCPPLRIQAGYPFFNVSRDTFTQFMSQCIDFLISLLAAY